MAESEGGRYTYEQLEKIAKCIKEKVNATPRIAIICGSGMGYLTKILDCSKELKYADIPDFPQTTTEGHEGCLVFGNVGEVSVVFMKGRFHFYEGYPLYKVTMPVLVFKMLGCSYLIATNASGSVNKKCKVGDIIVMKDHINLIGMGGNNPLRGPHDKKFGERFPAINKCYDESLQKFTLKTAEKIGIKNKVYPGVYVCVGGPNYETVAETKLFGLMGAHAIGMSTVPEVLVAKNCGMTILGLSLITEEGTFDYVAKKEPNHADVLAAAEAMEKPFQELMKGIIKYIGPCSC